MPEATVNKDGLPSSLEHEVWSAWQIPAVQAIAEAKRVAEAPNRHLGCGVFAANPCHEAPPFLWHIDEDVPCAHFCGTLPGSWSNSLR